MKQLFATLLFASCYVATSFSSVVNNTCSGTITYKLGPGGGSTTPNTPGGSGYLSKAPGAVWSPVQEYKDQNGLSYYQDVRIYPGPSYAYADSFMQYAVGGSDANWPSGLCPSVPDTNYCATIKIQNNDSVPRQYQIFKNGVAQEVAGKYGIVTSVNCDGTSKPYITLASGETGTYTFCATNYFTWTWQRWAVSDCYTDGTGGGATYNTNSASAPSVSTPTTTGSAQGGATYTGTTSNIVGNTSIGDSAIFDAVSKFANQNHSDLTDLKNKNWAPSVGVTNVNNNFNTNTTDMAGVTNLLKDIDKNLTNTPSSLASRALDALGFDTNQIPKTYADMKSKYEAGVAHQGEFEGLKGTYTGPSMDTGHGGGSTLEIPLGSGHAITADIMFGDFGNLWDVMRAFLGWILCAAYIVKVVKDCRELVFILATGKGIAVPNLQASIAGFGGNFGAGFALFFIVAFMTLMGVMLALIMTAATTVFTGSFSLATIFNGDFFSGASAGGVVNGISYLKRAVPMDIVIGLTSSYIIFRVTLMQNCAMATGILRWMIGG